MTRPKIQIYADLPHDLQEADELMRRYGIWATERTGGAKRCGSVEGRYQAERGEALEARREPKDVSMHVDEALRCQRALTGVPDRERIVLTALYVPRGMPPEAQLRILRIPPRLSQQRHLAGLRMLWNRYCILAGTRAYNRGTSQGVSDPGA